MFIVEHSDSSTSSSKCSQADRNKYEKPEIFFVVVSN